MRGDAAPPVVRIRPSRGWRAVDLREVWRYRELFWQLALRDIRVRYKQTVLGLAWAVLQPAFQVAVFTVIFGRVAGLDRLVPDGVPYPIYALCAQIPWQLFATAIGQSGGSVVAQRGLLTKVYFPRVVIPSVPILSGLADCGVALGLLAGLMAWYGRSPGPEVLLLPAFVLLAAAAALAVGLWLSALNALYRDVQYTLTFLTQLWLYATPVAYPRAAVAEYLAKQGYSDGWLLAYSLNPMVGVVDGFRWSVLGGDPPRPAELAASVLVVAAGLVGGLYFFRRMEATFADRV